MDNLTHTLVGAALGEAGLKKRTALGSATLMIGANFPDVDVLALFFPDSIDIRRGITHGLAAHVLLPFVLAGIMLAWDQYVRRWRAPHAEPANPRQLLLLAGVSIWTHPALDFMNSYGMRWLMPFVNKWFYADGLFIVDLWLMLALLAGVLVARRTRSVRPARAVLAGVAVYIILMLGITELGRREVAATQTAERFMVAPTPLAPWRRDVLLDEPDRYRHGTWSLFGSVALGSALSKGDTLDPAVARALQAPEIQGFLNWARFPFYRVEREGMHTVVRIADARYVGSSGRGWASVAVRLP